MRITALILASYISFLTAQPMMSPAYGCSTNKVEKKFSHSCCEKKEAKSETQKTKNNTCPGVCNPFGQGTCCLGVSSPFSFRFAALTCTKDFNSLTSVNLLSNYLADCFHPPEVA
jgi:hypothetical protein